MHKFKSRTSGGPYGALRKRVQAMFYKQEAALRPMFLVRCNISLVPCNIPPQRGDLFVERHLTTAFSAPSEPPVYAQIQISHVRRPLRGLAETRTSNILQAVGRSAAVAQLFKSAQNTSSSPNR